MLRPSFNTSLEPRARILFNHEVDTVSIDWKSFAKGEGSPGIITGQFPIRVGADSIKSLEVHCDEVRHMAESMLQSRDYLKNLQRLHVVGCPEQESHNGSPHFPEGQFRAFTDGNIKWPVLSCDLNIDGRYCALHFWFKAWNSRRSYQGKEWAVAFPEFNVASLKAHMSRLASRRFRERRALRMESVHSNGEGA